MAKAKYKVNNWSEYNKALVNSGSVTFCGLLPSLKANLVGRWG